MWDVRTRELVGQPLAWHSGDITCIAFSHDGKKIATGAHDQTIRLWDADTGRPIGQPMYGHILNIHTVGFSHDDKRVFSVAFERTIRFWDISNWVLQ